MFNRPTAQSLSLTMAPRRSNKRLRSASHSSVADDTEPASDTTTATNASSVALSNAALKRVNLMKKYAGKSNEAVLGMSGAQICDIEFLLTPGIGWQNYNKQNGALLSTCTTGTQKLWSNQTARFITCLSANGT